MNHQSSERPPVKTCHVCEGGRVYYLFSTSDYRVVRCNDCGLVFLNPQPSDDELARIYSANYFLGSDSETGRQAVSEIKQATATLYLSEIRRYRGPESGRLIEVGCGDGDFLVLAEADGWRVTGIEYSPAACEKARQRLKNGDVINGELQSAGMAANSLISA
jgi:SAM-dependent methyltransferase